MLSKFINQETCNEIVKTFNKVSPNTINEAKVISIMGDRWIFATLRTSNHQINGVSNQYPDYCGIWIQQDGAIVPANTVTCSGHRLLLKPAKGSFYAYNSVKIGFRKSQKNDSLKKILKKSENFAKKYISAIIENQKHMGHMGYVDYSKIVEGVIIK